MKYRDSWTQILSSLESAATTNKIRGFGSLPKGWHCGEGVAPSPEVIKDAIRIHSGATLAGLNETGAFAGINGEVRVTVYSGSEYLEFTVESDRSITFVQEADGREILSRPGLALDEVLSILSEFGRGVWASFGFFTTATTITDLDVFRRLHSEIPRMAPEFL